MTRALASASLAEGQQSTGAAVGRPVGRLDQDGGLIDELDAAADYQADPGRLGGFLGADETGDSVSVGDGERLQIADGGLSEQLIAPARAAQEREMRGALKFGIAEVRH